MALLHRHTQTSNTLKLFSSAVIVREIVFVDYINSVLLRMRACVDLINFVALRHTVNQTIARQDWTKLEKYVSYTINVFL